MIDSPDPISTAQWWLRVACIVVGQFVLLGLAWLVLLRWGLWDWWLRRRDRA